MAQHATTIPVPEDDDQEPSDPVAGPPELRLVNSGQLPMVDFRPGIYLQWVKPIGDRLAAALALTVLAVPMIALAGLVYLSMGRPILFRQTRVGQNGKEFDVLKFRTMNADRRQRSATVSDDKRLTHKSERDPRHTRVGRWLRRYSLDELPQLLNVLRGDMSLVGPRPELVSVVEKHYTEALHQRHLVKPGLTGLWQVSARGEGPMHENGHWDIDYVKRVSPATDFSIVLKTPLVMFGRRAGE